MSVHPGTFTVFVFLPSLHATINTSSFNQEFCKPYNWTWDEHTKDFDNIPQLPCLLPFAGVSAKAIGGSHVIWWIVALRNYFQVRFIRYPTMQLILEHGRMVSILRA